MNLKHVNVAPEPNSILTETGPERLLKSAQSWSLRRACLHDSRTCARKNMLAADAMQSLLCPPVCGSASARSVRFGSPEPALNMRTYSTFVQCGDKRL